MHCVSNIKINFWVYMEGNAQNVVVWVPTQYSHVQKYCLQA